MPMKKSMLPDADQRMADLLSLPKGTPLLRIRQLIFSSTARATVFVTGFYRSGRTRCASAASADRPEPRHPAAI